MATLHAFKNALYNNDLQGIKDNISAAIGHLELYLYYPANKGRLDIVEYLVHMGANVKGSDALNDAAYKGHLNVVKYLHKHGASINVFSLETLTYTYNSGDVIKYLLMNGATGGSSIANSRFIKVVSSCLYELMTGSQIVPNKAFLNFHGKLMFSDELKVQEKRIRNEARFKVLLNVQLGTGSGDLSFKF